MGGVVLSMASCEKGNESSARPEQFTNLSAQELELQMHKNIGKLSNDEQIAVYQKAEAILTSIKKGTLTDDPTLEEAFISIEGILNADFYQAWEDFDQLETETMQTQLPYYVDEYGQKRVDATVFGQAYNDLYQQIDAVVDPTNDEDFLMVDVVLESIDPVTETVVLSGVACIAAVQPLYFFTPGGAVYAAQEAEWCDGTPNIGGSFDAASFMQTYAHSKINWQADANQCANGYWFRFAPSMATWNKAANQPLFIQDANGTVGSDTWNQVINRYWKSSTNDCLGDNGDQVENNEIWYGLYNDMDFFINYGLTRVQNYEPQAQLYYVDFHSHDQNIFGQGNPDISERFYHGGVFQYVTIVCRP